MSAQISRIIDIPVGHFQRIGPKKGKLQTVEETGLGNTLCYEAYGGRLFRSDEGAVREAVDKFIEDYVRSCQNLDEDPAHRYYEVYNFNDLYSLLGILPTHFGDRWGYTNSEDYRMSLGFDITYVDDLKDTYFEEIGEPVLVIEPYSDCYPLEYYREV